MVKIYGHLVVQNGVAEVLRVIESIAPCVDEFLIMDGESEDGTWEVLQRYKDAYHLTLFSHKFDTIGNQRNRLLEKTQKDSWVISLDHDEYFNHKVIQEMRRFIEKISDRLYTMSNRVYPLTIGVLYYRLLYTYNHYDAENVDRLNNRIFFNDRTLQWHEPYHTYVSYKDGELGVSMIEAPDDWAIFHSAFLDKKRMDAVEKDILSGKRQYKLEEWDLSHKIAVSLPKNIL